MSRPLLEDMVFALFGGDGMLIGYEDEQPLVAITWDHSFSTFDLDLVMGSWGLDDLEFIHKYHPRYEEWLHKNWNNLTFTNEPLLFEEGA